MDYEQSSGTEWAIPSTPAAKAVSSLPQHQLSSENLSRVSEVNSAPEPVNAFDPLTTTEVSSIPQSHAGQKQGQKYGKTSNYLTPPPRSGKSKPTWNKKSPPDSTFELSEVYGKYRESVMKEGKSFLKLTSPGGDLEVFKKVSRMSKAFVQKPSNSEKTISIWGDPQSVRLAKILLSSLFEHCSAVATTNAGPATQTFAQMQANPFKVQNTSASQQQKKNEGLIYLLRRPPHVDPDVTPHHQMVFLWPDNEISIRQVLGVELEALDFLRLQYKCFIHLSEESEDVICVSGSEEETLQQAITHLETKWHELITSSTIKSKLCLLDLPVGDRRVRTILMKTINGFTWPCYHLNSNEAKNDDPELWSEGPRSENDSRLLSEVKRSLCCVPLIRGALAMRVRFGTFAFSRYRVPNDQRKGYSVAEFREMISHERARGRLMPEYELDLEPLMSRISAASHLFDLKKRPTVSLSGKYLRHIVAVEFDSIENEFLRLEVEFRAVGGRHERTKSRWIQSQVKGKFAENTPLLQATMLGAEKADWQFQINESNVLSAQQKSPAMNVFEHQVRFRDGVMQESLLAEPKPRAMLPDGFPVKRLIEKAAIQYDIKETEYVLEIARYDIYVKQSSTGSSNMGFKPPLSFWGINVHGVNWEENLAKLAATKEVQQMGFKSVLDPFFSPKTEDGNKASFQGFVNIVKEVAQVLGKSEVAEQLSPQKDDQAQASLL